MPPAMQTTESDTAPQPSRRSRPATVHTPARRPSTPSTIDGTGERAVIGGTATKKARNASTRPAQPTRRALSTAGSRSSPGPPPVATAPLTSAPENESRSRSRGLHRRRAGHELRLASSPARRPHLPAQPPQVDHQDVRADEQHDQPLDDRRERPCELGLEDRRIEVAHGRARQQRPEQQRGEERPHGGVAPQQGDRDP